MDGIIDLFNMLDLGNKVTIINAMNLLIKKQESPESVTVEQWDFIYKYGDPDERAKLCGDAGNGAPLHIVGKEG